MLIILFTNAYVNVNVGIGSFTVVVMVDLKNIVPRTMITVAVTAKNDKMSYDRNTAPAKHAKNYLKRPFTTVRV